MTPGPPPVWHHWYSHQWTSAGAEIVAEFQFKDRVLHDTVITATDLIDTIMIRNIHSRYQINIEQAHLFLISLFII